MIFLSISANLLMKKFTNNKVSSFLCRSGGIKTETHSATCFFIECLEQLFFIKNNWFIFLEICSKGNDYISSRSNNTRTIRTISLIGNVLQSSTNRKIIGNLIQGFKVNCVPTRRPGIPIFIDGYHWLPPPS